MLSLLNVGMFLINHLAGNIIRSDTIIKVDVEVGVAGLSLQLRVV